MMQQDCAWLILNEDLQGDWQEKAWSSRCGPMGATHKHLTLDVSCTCITGLINGSPCAATCTPW